MFVLNTKNGGCVVANLEIIKKMRNYVKNKDEKSLKQIRFSLLMNLTEPKTRTRKKTLALFKEINVNPLRAFQMLDNVGKAIIIDTVENQALAEGKGAKDQKLAAVECIGTLNLISPEMCARLLILSFDQSRKVRKAVQKTINALGYENMQRMISVLKPKEKTEVINNLLLILSATKENKAAVFQAIGFLNVRTVETLSELTFHAFNPNKKIRKASWKTIKALGYKDPTHIYNCLSQEGKDRVILWTKGQLAIGTKKEQIHALDVVTALNVQDHGTLDSIAKLVLKAEHLILKLKAKRVLKTLGYWDLRTLYAQLEPRERREFESMVVSDADEWYEQIKTLWHIQRMQLPPSKPIADFLSTALWRGNFFVKIMAKHVLNKIARSTVAEWREVVSLNNGSREEGKRRNAI